MDARVAENFRKRAARGAGLALVAAAALLVAPAAPAAPRRPAVDAAAIVRLLEAGKPVAISHARIRGVLRLPAQVNAPLSLRRCVIADGIRAASTTFAGLVDLTGTTIGGDSDFSAAVFSGPVLLGGLHTRPERTARFDFATFRSSAVVTDAVFGGPAVFTGTSFQGASRFRAVQFLKAANFAFAGFDDAADFAAAVFAGPASFGGAEFRSVADFTGATFSDNVAFDTARFSSAADFIGATFAPADEHAPPASFKGARFDGGGSFFGAQFLAGADFGLTQASEALDFETATFQHNAVFSTGRFLRGVDFSRADFTQSVLDLDQSSASEIDLTGTSLAKTVVVLPDPTLGAGRVDHLRLDPADVGKIRQGSAAGTRATREQALGLVESAARAAGDNRAANEAQVRRLTLVRQSRSAVPRVLDYMFLWGIGGYLVRPLHPAVAILALLLAGTLVRAAAERRRQPSLAVGAELRDGLRGSAASLTRVTLWKGSPGQQLEALAYKLLLLLLILNLGNVWPSIRSLWEGLSP